jgi:hypothetical protein
MSHIDPRIADLLSHPFYSRIIGAWRGRPRRRIVVPNEDGCLLFQGAVNSKGYGCVGEGLIHRLAWAAFHGPILPGMELHHRCRKKLCCNVDHLECLTKKEHRALEARPQKLTEAAVIQILEMLDDGAARREVARRFGVSDGTITDIRYARSWRPVVLAHRAFKQAKIARVA